MILSVYHKRLLAKKGHYFQFKNICTFSRMLYSISNSDSLLTELKEHQMEITDVIDVMYTSSQQNIKLSNPSLQAILNSFKKSTNKLPPDRIIDACYGLKLMTGSSVEENSLVSIVLSNLLESNDSALSAESISNVICGLQSINHQSRSDTLQALDYILNYVHRNSLSFNYSQLSRILSGLRGSNLQFFYLQSFAKIVGKQADLCRDVRGEDITSLIGGLKYWDHSTPGTASIYTALAAQIRRGVRDFVGPQVCLCLRAINGISTSIPERSSVVLSLLESLSGLADILPLSPAELADTLLAFHSVSSDRKEVGPALATLSRNVKVSVGGISHATSAIHSHAKVFLPSDVAKMLKVLEGKRGCDVEVRTFIRFLDSEFEWCVRPPAEAVYGVYGVYGPVSISAEEVESIFGGINALHAFHADMGGLLRYLPHIAEIYLQQSVVSSSSVSFIISGLRNTCLDSESAGRIARAVVHMLKKEKEDAINRAKGHSGGWTGADISRALSGLVSVNNSFRDLHSTQIDSIVDALAVRLDAIDRISVSELVVCFQSLESKTYSLSCSRLAKALTSKLRRIGDGNNDEALSVRQICQCVSAFKNWNPRDSIVHEVFDHLHARTRRVLTLTQTGNITGTDVSLLLSGLQAFNGTSAAVRGLLNWILFEYQRAPRTIFFSVAEIVDAVASLRHMTSDQDCVRDILVMLTQSLKGMGRQAFSVDDVSHMFRGIARMNGDVDVVRDYLGVLGKVLNSSRGKMDSRSASTILSSLRNSSISAEVEYILLTIARKMKDKIFVFSTEEISSALGGLRCLSSDSNSVTGLLDVLVESIFRMTQTLRFSNLAQCLYGLQHIRCNASAIKLIGALYDRTVFSGKDFREQSAVAMALFGLQHFHEHASPQVSALLTRLVGMMETLVERVPVRDVSPTLISNIHLSVFARDFDRSIDSALIRRMQAVSEKVENEKVCYLDQRLSTSNLEKRFAEGLRHAIIESYGPHCLVETSVFLHSFEADIVLRIPKKAFLCPDANTCRDDDDAALVINVEVDGPSHSYPTGRYHDRLRDAVLGGRGVAVHRVALDGDFVLDGKVFKLILDDCVKNIRDRIRSNS